MISNLKAVKNKATTLLSEKPQFGEERFQGAKDDYMQLAPSVRSALVMMSTQPEESREFLQEYQRLILQLVSQECAAGASAERCRAWFACLAELAQGRLQKFGTLAEPVEVVIYSALAGHFLENVRDDWPDDLATQQTSERVLYMLMVGKRLNLPLSEELFDYKYWLQLREAIECHDAKGAYAAFVSIADWWLAEYRDAEVPIYNPSSTSCFELLPNAALALANLREGLSIEFDTQQYRQFYVAALLY